MSSTDDLMEVLGNARIVFGLKNQGHIPTIERMLSEGSDWPAIGKAIGWEAGAAEKHYGYYLTSAHPQEV